jgi:perosamine synthetase
MHDEIGYNYRLPNINAALGCAQLEQLEGFIKSKRALYLCYKKAFAEIQGVTVFEEPSNCRSNYWLQTILLNDQLKPFRNLILEQTNSQGLMTRPVWALMNDLPMFSGCPRMDLSNATSIAEQIINIPSGANLVSSQV